MLFSNEEVAAYINENFEPAWESVRPVPRVTIDFGNGKVIHRTLHGNVATYACAADGRVLDVLPGIYEPKTYLARLKELKDLHRYARQGRFGRLSDEVHDETVKNYHRTQATALEAGDERAVFVEVEGNPRAIVRIEASLQLVMQPHRRMQTRARVARGEFPVETDVPKVDSIDDLPEWKALAQDTAVNETLRRRQIHKHLAELGPVPPDEIKKWLYREVLHADLDDPYLGLGKILFDNYPFAQEDAE